jgi:hypothetical protein
LNRRLPAFLLFSGLLAPALPAQDPHAAHSYGSFGDEFAALGDLDGDGIEEYALADSHGSVPPTIWILSGRTGRVIDTLCSDDPLLRFGHAISAVPDVDRDGVGEIAVGECGEPGRVALYSGRTRQRLRTIEAPPQVRGFGERVAGMRDGDGDGCGDLLVTCGPGCEEPFAVVGSGANGQPRFEIRAPSGCESRRIDPVGDVDGDGIDDLAFMGRRASSGTLLVQLVSGRDGSRLSEVDTRITSEGLGLSTLPQRDFDGDGLPEVLFCSRGVLQLRSGASLELLRSIDTPNLVPGGGSRGVALVGDVDADGLGDLALANPDESFCGSVCVLSWRTGRMLWRREAILAGRAADVWNAGRELVAIGDVDGDGIREFLWGPDNRPAGGPGLVYVSSGRNGHILRAHARAAALGVLCLRPEG